MSACADSKQNFSVYLDYSEVSTTDYRFKVKRTYIDAYSSENHSFSISLSVTNLTSTTQTIQFSNPSLVRESNGTSYTINKMDQNQRLTLDSEIEGSVSFSSTLPTTLDEKYYFSVDFKNISYKVFLYETPDELREDLTVSYKINGTLVNSETVKRGRAIQDNYVYDDKSYQNYSSVWKDASGKTYSKGSIVEENVTLNGTLQNNFKTLTTSTDVYTFISGINHVPADGKVVLLEKYQNKEICLGNFAIYNNSQIKEVYLPKTLRHIYSSNFSNCNNLKTIYFAGSQEQWEAIPKDFVTIPSSVRIVYNTSFSN